MNGLNFNLFSISMVKEMREDGDRISILLVILTYLSLFLLVISGSVHTLAKLDCSSQVIGYTITTPLIYAAFIWHRSSYLTAFNNGINEYSEKILQIHAATRKPIPDLAEELLSNKKFSDKFIKMVADKIIALKRNEDDGFRNFRP